MTQSAKGLAKIAEDASPRRHAEISPVKVNETYLMTEILRVEWVKTGNM